VLIAKARKVHAERPPVLADTRQQRSRAAGALAVATLALGTVAGFTLLFGIFASGGGHGSFTLWYVGLGFCWAAWLACASSLVLASLAWAHGQTPRWWFFALALLFLAASGLGLWGLRG